MSGVEAKRLESALDRLARLQQLTSALAAARTAAEVGRVIVGRGRSALGAATGVIILPREDGMLEVLAHEGVPDELIVRFRTIPPGSGFPVARTFVTGQPEWIESAAEYRERYPDFARESRGAIAGAVALPITLGERKLAVMAFRFENERVFDGDERELMVAFAGQAAQALDRALLSEQETRTRARLESVAAIADVLSKTLTRDEVAHAVVDHGMRLMRADTCTLYMLEDEVSRGGALELIAERGSAPEVIEHIRRVTKESHNASFEQLATGEPIFVENERGYAERFPHLAKLPSRAKAFWSVPLFVENRAVGLLGMGFYEPRTFSRDERLLVGTFTQQCAQALLRAHRLELAESASRAKDEFLATVSHELRTPLNAIFGWARMLKTADLDPPKREQAVAVIERNATAMTQLIEDLLDVSRIVSGKLRLDVQPVDLREVTAAALESVRPAADARGVHLEIRLESVGHVVSGDPGRLQQVVWNVLSNAVKFTPKGGRVTVSVGLADSSVEIVVADSGQGIEPSFLAHVFEPFRQADGGVSRAHGGLGLGLAIAHHLVELHGGTIKAESAGPSCGSTFTLRLPVSATRAPSAEEPQAGSLPRAPELVDLRVLVVDDDDDARMLVSAILKRCGSSVSVASNVEAAMAALRESPFDVLVADIGMPGENGYDLIRKIRALPPSEGGNIPAAALTAYARAEDRADVLAAGYATHLSKPIAPDDLVAVVASLAKLRV